MAATDEIDLRGIAYGNPTYATYTYDATTGVLGMATPIQPSGSRVTATIGLSAYQAPAADMASRTGCATAHPGSIK